MPRSRTISRSSDQCSINLAARFADRVALLVGGVVVAEGPPADVFTDGTLSHVYRTSIQVETHERLGRLVVHTE